MDSKLGRGHRADGGMSWVDPSDAVEQEVCLGQVEHVRRGERGDCQCCIDHYIFDQLSNTVHRRVWSVEITSDAGDEQADGTIIIVVQLSVPARQPRQCKPPSRGD